MRDCNRNRKELTIYRLLNLSYLSHKCVLWILKICFNRMTHCEDDLSHEQTLKERKENLSPSADGLAISFYTFLFDWLVGNWLVC